jgi:hypothetical protein
MACPYFGIVAALRNLSGIIYCNKLSISYQDVIVYMMLWSFLIYKLAEGNKFCWERLLE